MKVYLDNVIASGIARRDLGKEMTAVDALVEADKKGQIELFTSRWSWEEQNRKTNELVRLHLKKARGGIEVVPDDHRVVGSWNLEHPRLGTVSTNPIVTEIVDEPLLSQLKNVGISHPDAMHLMYAIHNRCDRFITLDTNDLLPRRSAVEHLCRGMTIVTPYELAAELSVKF